MATKDDTARRRADQVKSDLRSTTTCSAATVATLQGLLCKKDEGPEQKENVKGKAQTAVRRRGAPTATATNDLAKDSAPVLSAREKYILATETANTSLKNLADALKSTPIQRRSSHSKPAPTEDAPKPAKPRPAPAKSAPTSKRPLKERSASQLANSPQKRLPRRSSSYSSIQTTGPDAGLVATAECARIAFGYLGTSEATQLLGKDSQELQLENGILALIGKLVALGLDSLAVKEMRHLKKRLDRYLGHNSKPPRPGTSAAGTGSERASTAEKESLATLLHFEAFDNGSPALPVIASLQTYALRVLGRLNRPRIVEATWEHLKLSNPTSPVNLTYVVATTSNNPGRGAKQLESLAQTILALCPNISSSYDDKPLQPSPETALLLQHLAFKIRQKWWALAGHQCKVELELIEPFSKCLIAFARRSQLSPSKKYKMADLLYTELVGSERQSTSTSTAAHKALSSLAQAAGLSEEALRWLGSQQSTSPSSASRSKQTARLVRIATVTIDAFMKDSTKLSLAASVDSALDALEGGIGGSSSDLDALFLEVNAMRRAATRLLMARSTQGGASSQENTVQKQAVRIIASTVHYSARMVGAKMPANADIKAQLRHNERMSMLFKCAKSIIDSVMACCKEAADSEERWTELDSMLQECAHIILRFEEEMEQGANPDLQDSDLIPQLVIKLSNTYWAVSLQLRKAKLQADSIATAMQRSISLVKSRPEDVKKAGHLTMKLEQFGDFLEGSGRGERSRQVFSDCVAAYLESITSQALSVHAATSSLQEVFGSGGPLETLARVVRSHHRSFITAGVSREGEMAFFDQPELETGARGALLELQLGFYLRTLSKNRHWDTTLNPSIAALVKRLKDTYLPAVYPLRHLRLRLLLLQLSHHHAHFLQQERHVATPDKLITAGTPDEGLARFETHLNATYSLKTAMSQETPDAGIVRESFSAWESIIDSAHSWELVKNRIDDVESWLADGKSCVECLNAKGEEYLALPVMHLLVRISELQKAPDSSDLVTSCCALGLQFLRLGYTGKAGMSLAKAETIISRQAVSTEARLRWHIAYAEYLARIGNSVKCSTVLSSAQSLALADPQFMDLAKPSTTLSGRLRFNSIIADAAYVSSLLATLSGDYKDASRHARQCVTLYRRLWAALESKANAKKTAALEDAETDADEASRAGFDPLSSMRNDKGAPLVTSLTHDALNDPEFWSLVPSLYRGLMQHSQVFAHQGLLHEAIYIAEQAEKIASATKSPSLITDNAAWRADCWAQSGRPDRAKPILETLQKNADRTCLSIVGYKSAGARVHHWSGQYDEELASYKVLDDLLRQLTSPSHVRSLERFSDNMDALAEQMSTMTFDAEVPNPIKATATRGRKPAIKPPSRVASKTAARAAPKAVPRSRSTAKAAAGSKQPVQTIPPAASEALSSIEQCSILRSFQAELMHRSVLANLLQDNLANACALLDLINGLPGIVSQDLSHVWATFKTQLAQSFAQIAANFAVNTLPESTIAFPAVSTKERVALETVVAKRVAPAAARKAKNAQATEQAREEFLTTLRNARDSLAEAHAASLSKGPNYMVTRVSMALASVTILLSAVSGTGQETYLHPLYAAFMGEAPKCNTLKLMQESVEAEKEQVSRDECLRWPSLSPAVTTTTAISNFQKQYIDIIPESWVAVSMALNDARDELYVTRFEAGASPFLLRLPLARHAPRELDEEEFSFEDGKREFDELIELSDFSTRTAKDMTSREARQQWWTEREALDTRLHELLINMQNIWLGGFRGIFSQHERQSSLLARFRKSLENILNQHLPSRRKKAQQKCPSLDPRVLGLFIGLGDATDEALDLDEPLMDLIYFVVDILNFNGEHNAYDELDFDAMVVETYEALRAYHSASEHATQPSRHMILVLDNNLHGFPWESLPCLEKQSISRLPSLAALRERLLAAKPSSTQQNAAPGHYISAAQGGTSILNPSGDLSHTSKTIKPRLDELQGPWTHIANRAPSEKEFEDSLRDKDLVLYFGHGSGAQFVRSKAVRRLYPGAQDDHNRKFGCATTFLFGCSSVHLTENGIYEPSGMLASYLTAGAPAVVGMLWDVTDKDCDRFAVKAGELWGLWPEPQEDVAPVAPPKTPGRKTKGKGRVAQLVDEVEAPGSAKESKKAKDVAPVSSRRRGMGLDECVREARSACVLKYLNGAAAVVYGIPVYLE